MRASPRIAIGAAVATAVACASPDTVYHRDVAPIVYEHCTPCHRVGGGAPFPLDDFESVRKRAADIVEVTSTGYMPPWQPAEGSPRFVGERRLDEAQKQTLAGWVRAGTPPGDPADGPPPPTFAGGWQLGPPDLEVAMAEPFVLPADGSDEIRNFVLPVPVDGPVWVRTLELLPGNPSVVHHALVKVDRTPLSRRLDRQDPAPGFGGMTMGNAESPDGHAIVWAPGTTPWPGDPRIAWPLTPGSDLVLQLHMVPSGKAERVETRIGFHFAAKEPTLRPSALLLEDVTLDIPAGAADYVAEDALEIPVGIRVLSLFPHAHYLGRRMEVWADLPGGDRRTLLLIDEWDFAWQDAYRLEDPISLPPGSIVSMRYRFDNSGANPANPSYPPRRVVGGNRSTDEMATLLLQVVPDSPEDARRLLALQFRRRLERDPRDPIAHYNLGAVFAEAGDLDRAAHHYGRALELDPADGVSSFFLANVRYRQGRFDEAMDLYGETLRLDPGRVEAHLIRGALWERSGDPGRAAAEYRAALDRDPGFEAARAALARLGGE